MLRRAASLTLLLAAGCAAPRPTSDPPAAPGSMAPRLARFSDRVVLSWIEPDTEGVPTLRFAVRDGQGWSDAGTAVRDGRLRVSFHLYNTQADVDHLVKLLPTPR